MRTVPRDANERRRRNVAYRQWQYAGLAALVLVSVLMVFALVVR